VNLFAGLLFPKEVSVGSTYTFVLATFSLGLAVSAAAAAPATYTPGCCTHTNIIRASDDRGLTSQALAGPLKTDEAPRHVQPPQGAKLNQAGLSALASRGVPTMSDVTQGSSMLSARNSGIDNMVFPPEEAHNALTNNLLSSPSRAIVDKQIYPPNPAAQALSANLFSNSSSAQSKESMVNAQVK
jgi:hypothetical protein